MTSLLRHSFMCLALLLAAGCASVDYDYPRTESFAFADTSDTQLGRAFGDDLARHPADESGFYPLPDGVESLAMRLLLADRAERSIDAQYFLIHNDLVGRAFVHALLQAAERGVRVRLLIDDTQLSGYDAGLAALDMHENLEVRVFNPFAHRRVRGLDIAKVRRLSRRMHNKSFTVDNQIAVIGGRNIADEYFDASNSVRFGDLDVVTIGSTVPEVSTMFDAYWNNNNSVPIAALANAPDLADSALDTLHAKVTQDLAEADASIYASAIRSSILDFIQNRENAFTWAKFDLVFDTPDKLNPDAVKNEGSIVVQLRDSIGPINNELFLITPYLVLRKDELAVIRRVVESGASVTVLTNSLASNNHIVSHSGYAPIRKSLLEMGVKLHELRANASLPSHESSGVQDTKSTLHAKTFTVDRQRLFIGSFNWNQRSINLDTESGVVIHSPQLAEDLVAKVSAALPAASYEVFLDDNGSLRWRGYENGQEVILAKEPQSGFWRRFSAGFLRLMPIKGQL